VWSCSSSQKTPGDFAAGAAHVFVAGTKTGTTADLKLVLATTEPNIELNTYVVGCAISFSVGDGFSTEEVGLANDRLIVEVVEGIMAEVIGSVFSVGCASIVLDVADETLVSSAGLLIGADA
jgi:hypothetical protein